MSRLVKVFIVVVGLFALASLFGTRSAQAAGTSDKQLAFKAKKDIVTGETVTRVNNWSTSAFDGLVCAQERVSSGRVFHIGCLKVHLEPNGRDPWAFQFGVMPKHGGSVFYTYQAEDGTWHSVRSTTTL